MSSVKPSDGLPRLMVRFPPDIKGWLRQQAVHNGSSQTSEVVRSVRERMERQRAPQTMEG
ncbi:DNA-binding protein [Lichenibacterium minor]|jgi:hypothetical protein|uniref:DNA-binding protein n=1 Tax=Lichenibacterium minor TaxID=2316528 RepID=A0A4V1RU79_9HYPH|nr:DNA-binding protein [Lichenibacterium minor]